MQMKSLEKVKMIHKPFLGSGNLLLDHYTCQKQTWQGVACLRVQKVPLEEAYRSMTIK